MDEDLNKKEYIQAALLDSGEFSYSINRFWHSTLVLG
ncbi:hypothetical protein IMAU10142_01048 [Lactobacillus helveticus]|uniref:Uncharacterized protein n=1 Tax=Lactobacillus helveticus TaxID=1587 RepID=A0A9Q5C260_LACHE|nr:hypothetical protein [Lactobacillus helveticus]NRN79050.1 hypothetical protein [Lactobacillus helveticus]NRN80836.1 hypothetical protein [Lactobacillus helveticus]NRN83384.1 hypothetical protein [Lactobacillus helveticus]NRN85255.1 hypothetical protein [Lactobacillus helveticus]